MVENHLAGYWSVKIMKKFSSLFLTVIGFIFVSSAHAQISSVYTDLTEGNCKITESDNETGSEVRDCRSFGKWSLQMLYDDQRMSVNVIAPGKKAAELNFWNVVTGSSSSLGAKAEWRVKKVQNETVPIALIIRVNSSSDENGKNIRKSFLTVTKITAGEICVTHKIEDRNNANQRAREFADTSADKSCLQL